MYQAKRFLWLSHKRQVVVAVGEKRAAGFAQRELVIAEVVGNTWEPVVDR